jgi:hypothetical protein
VEKGKQKAGWKCRLEREDRKSSRVMSFCCWNLMSFGKSANLLYKGKCSKDAFSFFTVTKSFQVTTIRNEIHKEITVTLPTIE